MLSTYLKKTKVMTGPRKKNTSYSGLETLKKFLLGQPQFAGGEIFLRFGSALHEVLLENKYDTYKKLSLADKAKVQKMVTKLKAHPVVRKLLEGSIKEDKRYGKMHQVELAYILDIDKRKEKIGADLKTTKCKTYAACLEKAIEYGYPKQKEIYVKLGRLKEFYFIFICKEDPFEIFIIDAKELDGEIKYVRQELEFLLYVYKKYGRMMTEQDLLEGIDLLKQQVKHERKTKNRSAGARVQKVRRS